MAKKQTKEQTAASLKKLKDAAKKLKEMRAKSAAKKKAAKKNPIKKNPFGPAARKAKAAKKKKK